MKDTLANSDINLFITDSAIRQIQLIEKNDYTLEGHSFRIKISGKGCDGFTYTTGFSQKQTDDLVIKRDVPLISYQLIILMDPFTAYYSQEVTVDYLLNPETNEEGFIITNAQQLEHRGKFFKDTSKLPPWASK